ncbi:MAG: hypothetical protein IT534_10345 [Bauldia sp.]|nr:hypothetical protein [Bauldia sp.]
MNKIIHTAAFAKAKAKIEEGLAAGTIAPVGPPPSLPVRAEALANVEELHPDLRPYVVDGPFGRTLKHPLVFMHHLDNLRLGDGRYVDTVAQTNEGYEWKTKRVAAAINAGDWHSFVFLHERPHRTDALMEAMIISGLPLWELAANVWSDSENLWQYQEEWRDIFGEAGHGKNNRPGLMTPHERRTLAAQPRTFKVWRGVCRLDAVQGMSWTLSRSKALWFANRFTGDGPLLVSGTVAKRDVIAYFSARQEREIVVFPENVAEFEVTKLQPNAVLGRALVA